MDNLEWIDADGSHRSMSYSYAVAYLKEIYDEWPGGIEELQSSQETLSREFRALSQRLDAKILKLRADIKNLQQDMKFTAFENDLYYRSKSKMAALEATLKILLEIQARPE